ncbi:MAG: hypothetical protein KGZ75_13730 [Syntrophomonadaceae bacterium]|nr:hypothetical protein [Syntrophomonadaceae bacterium]
MSRIINKPVQVKASSSYFPDMMLPRMFRYRDSIFAVKVLEVWKDIGEWWNGEAEKIFYRVAAAGGSVFELYQDLGSKRWFLYKVYD